MENNSEGNGRVLADPFIVLQTEVLFLKSVRIQVREEGSNVSLFCCFDLLIRLSDLGSLNMNFSGC